MSLAKAYGKSPSTISIQHKKALKKFNTWIEENKSQKEAILEDDFDRQVFGEFNRNVPPNVVIAKHGRTDRVLSLWEKHRQLMEDEICRILNILADQGVEVDEDSEYPLSEAVKSVCDEIGLLLVERQSIWWLLEENHLTYELDEDEDSSAYEAVKRLVEDSKQKDHALVSEIEKKWALERRIAEVENRLKVVLDELKEAKADLLKKTVGECEQKIEELQVQKVCLEGEVNKLKRVKAEVESDIRDAVLEFLARLQLHEVMKLYNLALKTKLYKTIAAQ